MTDDKKTVLHKSEDALRAAIRGEFGARGIDSLPLKSSFQYGAPGLLPAGGVGAVAGDRPRPAYTARVIGPDETVDIRNGSDYFRTLAKGDLNAIIGREVGLDADGKAAITAEEADMIGGFFAVLDSIRNSPLTETRRIAIKGHETFKRLYGSAQAHRLMQVLGDRYVTLPDNPRSDRDARALEETTSELLQWLAANPAPVLQHPGGTVFHKLVATLKGGGDMITADAQEHADAVQMVPRILAIENVLLVEHDWAAAFTGAADYDGGELRLPFDLCCFEFRISGRRVCALFHQGKSTDCVPMFATNDGAWIAPAGFRMLADGTMHPTSDDPMNQPRLKAALAPVMSLIGANVRAIAISLDAEVTHTEIVRADEKLNRARARRGKLPLYDYHTVVLAARHRRSGEAAEPDPDREIVRKRLHFRRGHWRHHIADEPCGDHRWKLEDPLGRHYCETCASWRRWIKWQLVGDPDLGFVDKHYRL